MHQSHTSRVHLLCLPILLYSLSTNALNKSPADCYGTVTSCFGSIHPGTASYDEVNLWVWAGPNITRGVLEFVPTITSSSSKTVVTVINTDLDVTRTTTYYPPNYTPPPPDITNSDGTQIAVVNYTRFGKITTATVTFPTPLIDWPDSYVHEFISNCSTFTETGILSSNPQSVSYLRPGPTDVSLNPRGLGYSLLPGLWNYALLGYNSHLFPDRPAFKCVPHGDGDGPAFAAFTETGWYVVTSTVFEGTVTTSSSSTSIGSNSASPGGTLTSSTLTSTQQSLETTSTIYSLPSSTALQSSTGVSMPPDTSGTTQPTLSSVPPQSTPTTGISASIQPNSSSRSIAFVQGIFVIILHLSIQAFF